MRVEIKENPEQIGLIFDVWNNDEFIDSRTCWYDDLKEQFRNYLRDMADDDNVDIETVEDWDTWLEEEKEAIKERLLDELKEKEQ